MKEVAKANNENNRGRRKTRIKCESPSNQWEHRKEMMEYLLLLLILDLIILCELDQDSISCGLQHFLAKAFF